VKNLVFGVMKYLGFRSFAKLRMTVIKLFELELRCDREVLDVYFMVQAKRNDANYQGAGRVRLIQIKRGLQGQL